MIGIIILNYNTWNATKKCIESIFLQESYENFKIYIVDNNSSNPMPNDIKKIIIDKQIIFLQESINKGYNAGNNRGVIQAIKDGCGHILICNNDIIFEDRKTINNMMLYLDTHRHIGIVGPKILLPDYTIQEVNMIEETTLLIKYKNIFKKIFLRNFLKKENKIKHDIIKNNMGQLEVFAVSGCCLMLKKECVKLVTPFDENVFLYEEENILGYQMKNTTYSTMYNSREYVIHEHGRTTREMGAFSYSCFVESEIYFLKNYAKKYNFQILPLYIIRSLKYISLCFCNDDYKKNLNNYFKKTFKKLLM